MSQEGINSSTLNNECSTHNKQHTQNNESNESSFNGFTRNHRRKRTKPLMVTDQQNYFDNDLNQSPPSFLTNSQRPPSEEQPVPSSTDENQLGSPASNLSSVENSKASPESAQDLSESGLKVVRRICDICQFESTDLEKFKTHIKFHSVALKCWYCHAVFAVAEFLKHHVDQCVNRGRIRDCSYCGQQFFDRESLLSHEYYFHHLARSATNEARQHVKGDSAHQYRCPVCYEKVSSFERYQGHLDGHMNAGINEDGLECKLCRLTFLNQLSLQSHLASPRHREVAIRVKNLFRCYHCGTIFINRDTYAMHMLEIAREESHNSLAQKGIQGSIEPLQKTTDTAHPTTSEHNSTLNATNLVIKREKDDEDGGEYYSNNNCDFGEKFNPLAPLINVNESMKAVNLTLSGRAKSERDFPYKCHACDRQLVDQDMFAMHMLQHAKETANQKKTTTSVTTATPTTPSIKTEPTDAPPYETSRSDDYSAVSVLCSFCGSSFPSRDSLAMHVMIEHTNSRSSQNNNNATGYTTLENLINSLYHDNNTGIRVARGVDASYSCPVCKQSAKDQDALAMHMLLHSHIPTSASRLDFSDSNPLSRGSPISMHDWQRSVLLALYKDQSSVGLQNLYSQSQRGDSSTRSNNDIEGLSNSYMDNGAARRGSLADSEVTSTDTMSRDIYSDTGELFDGNIIVYDKQSETWSCTVCKIDFRTLLYVTRHLGHVSHKLQVEKRLRAEMFTDGKSSGGDKLSSSSQSRGRASDVFSCGKCHAMFRSKHAYYRHFISSEHCRAFDNKNSDDASPTKRLRLSSNEGPAATIQRPRNNGLKDAVSRQYEQHTPKRQVVRRRSSTQSAPCWSESEQSRVDIPSPMSVRSHRDISFLSPHAVRRQSTDTSVNMDVDDAKSRGSCTPQSDSTTDVLDFVLKQSVLLMCKFCQVIFCDRTMYYLHMGLHNHNNPWQCNLCGKVCNGVHEFSSHVIHYN